MKLARRALLLVAATAGAGACANVVGVADYKDAVDELCGPCDAIPGCADRLREGLAQAEEEEVVAWLEQYVQLGCDGADCQLELARCFYSAPGMCVAAGEACETSESCCGFDFGQPAAGAGCCDGGGSARCCEDCKTCADAAAAFESQAAFDEGTLCRTQVASWEALLGCVTSGVVDCDAVCATMGADACHECLQAKCPSESAACGFDEGF